MAISTGRLVRYMAWSTLIIILAVLFIDSLGQPLDLAQYGIPQYNGEEAGEPNFLIGFILFSTGVMILTETIFTRRFPNIDNPRSLSFILGLPSGIVAILVGISWIFGFSPVIRLFGPTLDGVYLSGLVILLYEGLSNHINVEA